ncbi:MAG: glycosyltransferase family A protein [Chitinophagaceae bacterium]
MTLAPIVLFVYNRPTHTQQTLEALAKNDLADKSILYVYCDGAKEGSDDKGKEKIKSTREVVKSRQWCKEVIVIEQDKNNGLANSIISGVTDIVNKHGSIIVLEDDIIVSPYFLKYMNDGLRVYKDEQKVICIHSYNYPINASRLPETFFMRGADCWGWATWARGWSLFESDAKKLLSRMDDESLHFEFDMEGTYPYIQMLKYQIENKVDSWAICWHASAFINNKYTLYPKTTLIYNAGFDNSGTHNETIDSFNNKKWNNKKPVNIKAVNKIETNKVVLKRWKKYFSHLHNPTNKKKGMFPLDPHALLSRIYNRVKREIRQGEIRKPVSR